MADHQKYEFKKVKDITEAQLQQLQRKGWEYAGEVTKKDADGERAGTGILRFRRPLGGPDESDVVLSPDDVKHKVMLNGA